MVENESLRNNDRKLIVEIWRSEMPTMTYCGDSRGILDWTRFTESFLNGTLTSSESICRNARTSRRKHPEWCLKKKVEEEKKVRLIYKKTLF